MNVWASNEYKNVASQESTLALACFEGVGPVFIFLWPDGPLLSRVKLFTIVLDSFHQLSLPTQQLNIIGDSQIHGLALSVETSHHLVYKFSITPHGVAAGDARRTPS